jgi:hypothetical protein
MWGDGWLGFGEPERVNVSDVCSMAFMVQHRLMVEINFQGLKLTGKLEPSTDLPRPTSKSSNHYWPIIKKQQIISKTLESSLNHLEPHQKSPSLKDISQLCLPRSYRSLAPAKTCLARKLFLSHSPHSLDTCRIHLKGSSTLPQSLL